MLPKKEINEGKTNQEAYELPQNMRIDVV